MRGFPINSIGDLEKISASAKWQHFEKLVAFILAENGFDARQNVVIISGSTKRQFDVIAAALGKTFLVECKKWRSRKEMLSALKTSARKHLDRCSFYSELRRGEDVVPVVVTLLDSGIGEHGGVPIVPIMKLNSFLQEFGSA